ncbi:hypothetical protein Afil01_55680 [Actinorhabdospora filicis]|uniref:Hemolysin-type calcium-binding repeat-containing protein n=1 Tax=Actinorhabdospora filicis TaxID=1785913 RepID=A0A9W6SR33_9ACTN|nr:M91 family zinc metallopeptidase [Actinorhabdospora filicis]GLZ80761.1 hypothetical protein Afil01_55680 [Actinorhabdospora filicis]
MAEPEINVDRLWWRLKADPAKITASAAAWRKLGTAVEKAGDDFNGKAKVVYDAGWEGAGRQGFEGYQRKMSKELVDLKGKADNVATALDNIAGAITAKQGLLTNAEQAITGAVPCVVGGTKINFKPQDPKQSQQVLDAVTTAKGIRTDLDKQLGAEAGKLRTAASDFATVSSNWFSAINGSTPYGLPPEATRVPRYITLPDGRVVVNTGTGDDKVKVYTDPQGNTVVEVNGVKTTYPPGTDITVRGGAGDDDISVETTGANVNVNAIGGDGNDKITGGGDGRHTYLGGAGDDKIVTGNGGGRVSGNTGKDNIKGGKGDDNISTGSGADNIEDDGGNNYVSSGDDGDTVNVHGSNKIYTGDGDDTVHGGEGDDVIASGRGDDRMEAGQGNDRVYGGDGRDYIDGGRGDDHLEGNTGGSVYDAVKGRSVGQGDTIYGGDGNDDIIGTDTNDYIDGGDGNDTMRGGDGDDVLSGGKGDDTIDAGSALNADGKDVIYNGHGRDTVTGDASDTDYRQGDDNVDGVGNQKDVQPLDVDKMIRDGVIQIKGSDEFKDRIIADLQTYGSSPTGIKMLNLYNDNMTDFLNGDSFVIKETHDENGYARNNGIFSDDIEIEINPKFHNDDGPGGFPATVLYHEMGHGASHLEDVYDDDKIGVGPDADIRKSEHQATGIPNKNGSVYNPKDPGKDLDMGLEYTENGIRQEMGLDPRETYSSDGR